MLYCVIAFILGWMVSKHMVRNGFNVGADKENKDKIPSCGSSIKINAGKKI